MSTTSPGAPVPPDELIDRIVERRTTYDEDARTFAAWGADEQLRLCVEWLKKEGIRTCCDLADHGCSWDTSPALQGGFPSKATANTG